MILIFFSGLPGNDGGKLRQMVPKLMDLPRFSGWRETVSLGLESFLYLVVPRHIRLFTGQIPDLCMDTGGDIGVDGLLSNKDGALKGRPVQGKNILPGNGGKIMAGKTGVGIELGKGIFFSVPRTERSLQTIFPVTPDEGNASSVDAVLPGREPSTLIFQVVFF